MNYLAHGMRFADTPYRLAGTAVPDWLRVSDRHVRMRERHVRPHLGSDGPLGEVASGVVQHLADDDWFHNTPAFHHVTSRLTRLLREAVGTDGFRCGFLGHILGEMLLDTVIARRDPAALGRYYAALDRVDPDLVTDSVNMLSHRGEATRLAEFVVAFRNVRFLEDYLEPDRLLFRLNQVQHRVGLPKLPGEVTAVIETGEVVVAEHIDGLLPRERFEL